MKLAIGWTIVHSLWQGAVVALVLGGLLSVIRGSRARYTAACAAMLAILFGFGMTLSQMMDRGPVAARTMVRGTGSAAPGTWDRMYGAAAHFSAADVLPWLAPLWITGVVLFHLYSLASWLAARRMRRRGVCPATDAWQQRLTGLRERLRLSTPVTLLESALAGVPVVIGYLRPVILVPAGMLAGMSAGQVEAILMHELAHIRRHDYLINLLQTVVEGFLFYHPAVWWISGVIRAERENCCDDLVVAVSGDAHGYASALAALEQTRWAATDAALAANGGNLMKRVRRLLYPLETPRRVLAPALSAIVVTVTVALALTAWQAKSQEKQVKQPDKVSAAPQELFDQWLNEDVVYIITNEERAAFKALRTNDERKKFMVQFWQRRDPTPDTVENEFKEEHYRRIGYADDHFMDSRLPGWKTDRGRIYIKYGPPDEIESHPSGGTYLRPDAEGGDKVRTYPFELWRYRRIQDVGDNVIIEFVDVKQNGEFHMTKDPNEKVVK